MSSNRDYLTQRMILIAINPDRLRALLGIIEGHHPDFLQTLEASISELDRNL